MRSITLIIFLCSSLSLLAVPPTHSTLGGIVTDTSGAVLPGAVIELPDLHTGATADAGGRYSIPDLPSGRFLATVRLLGFATQSKMILLNGATTADFRLREAVLEQHEIVVTGTSAATEQRRSVTPIQALSARRMRENVSSNIIDAITRLPGVQQLTTGPAISKPVIRGLGFNRIVTLTDGIRQEGQQWGDEHGIEVDDYNVSRVEVLKGPASLSYGSDAIAGVINIISEDPASIGRINATLLGNYQTNNSLSTLHGRIAGNQQGIQWSVFYTGERAHDYQNSYDGSVFNTRFSNTNFGANMGISRHWGSSRLSFTSFNQLLGIAEGARDSATGRFIKPVDENGVESFVITDADDEHSFGQAIPRQQINHQKLAWVNTFYLANEIRLGVTAGVQQNERREFEDVLQPDNPGLCFRLRSFNYNAYYLFADQAGWQVTAGVNGMLQRNDNKGNEFLIPDYSLFDIGAYVIAKKEIGKWLLAGGLRADYRQISSAALFVDSLQKRVPEPVAGGYVRFEEFTRSFSSPSGSAGVSYALNKRIILKLNVASGFRAPNIAELSANGVHEGAIRYEYGNQDLKAEHSYQADLGGDYTSGHLSLNGAIFYNHILNFIYVRKLTGMSGLDSIPESNNEDAFPAFVFAQTTADLFGGELYVDYHPHPLDWLHFENTFSYVRGLSAGNTDSTRNLPNIPAPRWLIGLRAQRSKPGRFISSAYFKIELDNYFSQDKIFNAYGTETVSPAYLLLNASLGFDIIRKQQPVMSLTIAGQNLGDISYQAHLSRLRYADVNRVNGRTGIYNIGRNISLQITVPLSLR